MSYFCEDPRHEGDRGMSHDYYVLTMDLTTRNTDTRLARRGPKGHPGGLRLCGTCAERWQKALESGSADIVMDPGFTPVTQEALL